MSYWLVDFPLGRYLIRRRGGANWYWFDGGWTKMSEKVYPENWSPEKYPYPKQKISRAQAILLMI